MFGVRHFVGVLISHALIHTSAYYCCIQCVKLAGTSCPTGTARSFRSGAATQLSTTQRHMTQWCVSPGHTLDSPSRSRQWLTITVGHTSCWYPTMMLRRAAGLEPPHLMPFSATTKTTRLHGSDSALIQQMNNSTIFYSRYDHLHEVWPVFGLCPKSDRFSNGTVLCHMIGTILRIRQVAVAKYCNKLVCVCLSVCMSTRISTERQVRPLPNLLCMLPMVVARFSSGEVVITRGLGTFGGFLPIDNAL